MSLNPFPRPLFWLITGSDFGRSIKWVRARGNLISEAIKRKLAFKKP